MTNGNRHGLLAVDLGLRTGLAAYSADGRLVSYRSQRVANRSALRRAVPRIVSELGPLAHVVVEGDASLATIWARAAARAGAELHQVSPERWRASLLHPSEARTADAKAVAERLAREVIAWSEAPRPTALRDDAAEAICIGLWGCLEVGWLDALPAAVRRENRRR